MAKPRLVALRGRSATSGAESLEKDDPRRLPGSAAQRRGNRAGTGGSELDGSVVNRGDLHSRSAAPCRLPDFRKALGMFTGRWKLEILWLLYQRSYRVAELRRALPSITQPVLTAKLQELEEDGLVKRNTHQGLRPDVEYEMTAGAGQFGFFVHAVMSWAREKPLAQDPDRFQMDSRSSGARPKA